MTTRTASNISDRIRESDRSRRRAPEGLVERTRLDARYETAVGRVLRVLAPAGYGKSTLVSRWTSNETRAVRWLDLERSDNDPHVLGVSLDEWLDPLVDESQSVDQSVPEFSTIRRSLARKLQCAPPCVLVLDDVHQLESAESVALVTFIAEVLPHESTLVLVGRSFPNGVTARLRLDPGVDDISAADLAFELGETEQLLRLLDVDPDLDLVTDLHRRFEGWPAGLRLVLLAAGPSAAGNVELNESDQAESVTDYVAQEWLGRLDATDHDLLTCAACLGRFNAEMCDTVLRRTDCDAALRRLAVDEAIIVSADPRRGWYRMHPLVSRSLAAELRSRDRSRWREVHRAASAWWVSAGEFDRAFEHALSADDIDGCERLIVDHGPTYMARGLSSTVMRWMNQIGDDRLLTSPDLCFLAALTALQAGAGERSAQLVRMIPDLIAGQTGEVEARGRSVRAVLAHGPADEAIATIDSIVGSIPPGAWRATVRWALGSHLYLIGDNRSRDVLLTAAAEADLTQMSVLGPNIRATIAAIEMLDGPSDPATAMARRSVAEVAEQRAESTASTGITSAAAALAEARAGHHDLARSAARHARHLLDSIRQVAPWVNTIGRLAIARTCLLIDDPLQGTELLDQVVRIRGDCGHIGVDEHIEKLRSELEIAAASRGPGAPALTDAELRVLQFLPTNLSLAEVARRLYVSRNTVKSHVASIYRKFGTTSRGEAVDLATRAGLLDGGSSPA